MSKSKLLTEERKVDSDYEVQVNGKSESVEALEEFKYQGEMIEKKDKCTVRWKIE